MTMPTYLKEHRPRRSWLRSRRARSHWYWITSAVLVEQHDEWEAGDRRYLSEVSMAELKTMNTPTTEPVEEAILLPELTAA